MEGAMYGGMNEPQWGERVGEGVGRERRTGGRDGGKGVKKTGRRAHRKGGKERRERWKVGRQACRQGMRGGGG